MQSKLRAILGDRILVVLVLVLLVQSYRVADQYHIPATADQPPTLKDMVDHMSEGGSIEIPLGDGDSKSISLPLGKDGKPIDIRPLFVEGGARLEENYFKAEREYGPADPRTMQARSGYAAVLLYRGEDERAMELFQTNYDLALQVTEMAPDRRLDQLLSSVTALEKRDGNDERLMRLLPIARAEAYRAPLQAARILNKIASMYLETDDYENARLYFTESARLPLNYGSDKSVIAETQLGLTAVHYKRGDVDSAQAAARQLMTIAMSMPEEDAFQRDLYFALLTKIFAKLGDSESLAQLKRLTPLHINN